MSRRSISAYDAQAKELSDRYEALEFVRVHGWLLPFLPETRGMALDIGAGSGRDAKGLLDLGFDVVAVEPSFRMREEGKRRHPDPGIVWVNDALPGLESLVRQGLSFDLILASAVWMHISPDDRSRAFRKLVSLLKSGGILAMTLRHGPPEEGRTMYEVSIDEVEGLAKTQGVAILHSRTEPDFLGRSEVSWSHIILKFPDDETGALPLLRHVILQSDKSSTYKLGLLRAVSRIADGSQGMARSIGEDMISIPLGLLGLFWVRLYKPLVDENLPQTPSNQGTKGLGFIKDSWSALTLSSLDLRPGMRVSSENSNALHRTIRDAVDTITKMPAHFMTFPGTQEPIFKAIKIKSVNLSRDIYLDEAYLRSFGEMLVPVHLWKALVRYDAWIEPALESEWIRLMEGYLEKQGKESDIRVMIRTMQWSEPSRDVSLVKKIGQPFLSENRLFCVWSGKRLTEKTFEVDHCFPWAVWPCDDLWNLFPAHRTANHQKSARLPSARVLLNAADRIMEWWNDAYSASGNFPLKKRFYLEARGTLTIEKGSGQFSEDPLIPLEKILDGIFLKRLALRTDQGVEEWNGPIDGQGSGKMGSRYG